MDCTRSTLPLAMFPTRRAASSGGRAQRARAGFRRALALSVLTALLSAHSAAATTAPRLRALLKTARLVVAGSVANVTSYDDDRVAVVTVSIDRVLKGSLPGTPPASIALVELHEGPTRPGLTTGTRGIAFLQPASHMSYLATALPAATYYEVLPEFGAFLTADSKADLERNEALIARMVTAATGKGLNAEQERELTIDLLASANPLLVEDGAAGLSDLGGKRALTPDETATLLAALQRADLPDRVRLALIDAVGTAGLTEAIPALQAIDSPPPIAEAAWRALDKLGQPPSEKSLTARLANRDAPVRAAAVRELLRRDGVAAIPQVAPLAVQDPDPSVRKSSVEALGALGRPEALPPLERVFAVDTVELQQAAGRAILAVGGEPTVDALGRLAFEGPIQSQRYAVILLMTLSGPYKEATLQRIGQTHTDEQIRDLVASGFPIHEN